MYYLNIIECTALHSNKDFAFTKTENQTRLLHFEKHATLRCSIRAAVTSCKNSIW